MWHALVLRLRRLVDARRWDRELEEELAFHRERKRQELSARGLSGDLLDRATAVAIGNTTHAHEEARAIWVPRWLDHIRMDLRQVWRALAGDRALSIVVVAILALGIGLNTAAFSVVRAVLLRPLAFVQPERMLWLATLEERGRDEFVTSHDFVAWQGAQSLEHLVAYDVFNGRVAVDGISTQARIATVTADFWKVAGARAERGRLPAGGAPEVALSWDAFTQRFGTDDAIIGAAVVVSGRAATIVGVLPPRFRADLVQPATWAGSRPRETEIYQSITVRADPSGAIQLFRVIGQIRAGLSIESARDELARLRASSAWANPNASVRPTLVVVPLEERLLGRPRNDLRMLLGAVALVLLIGCANIAGLLIARATVRQKDFAVRTAVGAGRATVVRPVLLEGLLLSVTGGLGGLAIATWCLGVGIGLIPAALPRLTEASLDGPVLIFALTASMATAVLFNLGPAILLWRTKTYEMLREGTRTQSTGRRGARLRHWLVAVEIALAVVLLCGAGLLIRSLMVLRAYPAGFVPAQTLSLSVAYNSGGLTGGELRPQTYIAEALRRGRLVPHIEAIGMTTNASGRVVMVIEGAPAQARNRKSALLSSVSEEYAAAIGMRVVKGRWLTDHEPAAACVINEQLAARDFPDQDPIGRRIQTGGAPGGRAAEVRFSTIVGVVADLRYTKLETAPEPEVFVDYRHGSPFAITFVARVSGDTALSGRALHGEIARVDPTQVVSQPVTVERMLNDSVSPRRFAVFLLTVFAGAAVLLAAVGIYGLLAYLVAVQKREIGIRLAMGATSSDIARLVLRRAGGVVSVGLLAGLLAAFLTTRALSGFLYGITPTDPIAFTSALAVLMTAALVACTVPALKAARLPPAIALRSE